METSNKDYFRAGDALVRSKSIFGIIDHYGISVGDRKVIENHPAHGVRLVSIDEFLQGHMLLKVKTFPGNDWDRADAVSVAYKMIGTRYHVFDFNCEHFVNVIHRSGLKSAQADTAKGLFFGLLALSLVVALVNRD